MTSTILARSRALWNRSVCDLRSDETLAQILDRGSLEDFRELYRLARSEPALRQRIRELVARVPLPLPYFWLAALASLAEPVDYERELPNHVEHTGI
jgi:hypothetical protein